MKYLSVIIGLLLLVSCNRKNYITWDDINRIDQRGEIIPFIAKFDSTAIKIINSKLRRSVIDFGADRSGKLSSVSAFRKARDYAVRFREPIYIPNGVYNLDDSIQIPGGVNIYGEDKDHTIVYNNSLTPNRATFTITNGKKIAFSNEISNIFFITGVNTIDHIALEIIDASFFNIHDCKILGNSYFTGTGIKVCGREGGTFKNLLIYADKPIVISNNPNSNIDADHFNFNNLYLGASNKPVVTIEEDVFLLNMTFDGYQAWVGGSYGLYWNDTKSQSASTNLKLDNVRWEQEQDKNGYFIYINHNYALQNLILNNIYGGLNANGFYFNKVSNVSINESQYVGRENKIGIQSGGHPGYSIIVRNSNIQGKLELSNYRLNSKNNNSNYEYSFKDDRPYLNYSVLSLSESNLSAAPINSLFLDALDGKLKYKDAKGNVFIVVLQK